MFKRISHFYKETEAKLTNYNKIKELCFDLVLVKNKIIDNDQVIDDFIDFAVENGISIGGNLSGGFCFCTESKSLPEDLEFKFVNYIKEEYNSYFREIIFKKFVEEKDEFIEKKRIFISSLNSNDI